MAAAERRQKDSATAAYMKAHPGQFPDSVMRQNTPRAGTPALAFTVQPARGGPIPHVDDVNVHKSARKSEAA